MECAAAPVAPLDGVEYPLVLGPTLLGGPPLPAATPAPAGGSAGLQQFYALHYNFKPTSIDTSRPGALRHGGAGKGAGPGNSRASSGGGGAPGGGSSRVFLQLANNQAGKADVEFEGQEDSVRELDCVLLFDGHSVRVERLHHSVRLTHRTDKQAVPGVGAGGAAGTHQQQHHGLALSHMQAHAQVHHASSQGHAPVPGGAGGSAAASSAQGLPASAPAASGAPGAAAAVPSLSDSSASHPSRLSPFNDASTVTDGRASPLLFASAAAVPSQRKSDDVSATRPGPRRSPLPSRPFSAEDRAGPASMPSLMAASGAGARHTLNGREEGTEGKSAQTKKRPSQEAEAALRGTASGAPPPRGQGLGPGDVSAVESQRRRSADGSSQASPSKAHSVSTSSASAACARDPGGSSAAAEPQARRAPGPQGVSPSKPAGQDGSGKRHRVGGGVEQGLLSGRVAERIEPRAEISGGVREETEVGLETHLQGHEGGGSHGLGAGSPVEAGTPGEEEVEVVVEEVIGEEEEEEEVIEYEEIVVEEEEEEEDDVNGDSHEAGDDAAAAGEGEAGRPGHSAAAVRGTGVLRQSEGGSAAEGRARASEGRGAGAGTHSQRHASGDDAGSGGTTLDGDRRASAMVEVGLQSSDESASSKELSGSDESSSTNESDDEEEDDDESLTSGSDI